MPFNVTGSPAMSVCCGYTEAGLPLSFQIVGKPFEDATVLRRHTHTSRQRLGAAGGRSCKARASAAAEIGKLRHVILQEGAAPPIA